MEGTPHFSHTSIISNHLLEQPHQTALYIDSRHNGITLYSPVDTSISNATILEANLIAELQLLSPYGSIQ
jgi:hypothetical protein